MTKSAVKERGPTLFGGAPATVDEAIEERMTAARKRGTKEVSTAVQKLPAPAEPKNMLAIIAAAAADPRVDVAKMKELLAIQREIEQAQEAREFNSALLAAQEEMPKIVKDRANEHTHSRYATLEKVSKEVDHIARKHGFSMSFGTDDSPLKDHYRIVCDLSHTAGCVRRYKIDLKSDDVGAKGTSNKTPVQGVGSTMSYGRRYLKVMMFDLIIVGEDSDGNKRGGPKEIEGERVVLITREQMTKVIEAVKFCGVGERKFCAHYNIAKIPDLPAERFDDAMKACKDYQEKHSGKGG